MKEKPKPVRKFVPVEKLTFDNRHQMRALKAEDGTSSIFDEAYVKELIEAREDGAAFPPIDVVEEKNYKGKAEPKYWVFDGFNRGEMYRRLEVPSIEVMAYEGTDDAIRNDVLAAAKSEGGIMRAIRNATGLSQSVIGKYLPEFGWRVNRIGGKGELQRIEEPPPVVLTNKDEAFIEDVTESTIQKRRARGRKKREAGPSDGTDPMPLLGGYVPPQSPAPPSDELAPLLAAAADLERMQKLIAAADRLFDRLIVSPVRDALIRHAAAHGVRISKLDRLPDSAPIRESVPMTEIWNWEAIRAIKAAMADVHNGMVVASLDTAILA